jgi:pimeloyl-ACP methyl ester carboxylesterase
MITRREFSLAMGVAAVAATSAAACSSTPPAAPPTSAGRTSFPALKQVDAGLLNVGYAEDGPADGPPVILLHGWPYDIYSYVDVAPVLAAKGYRVIVPYLRGFGTTHFLSDKTFRNGQQAALAADIVAFMDALKIPQAVIGGFDWGARTASRHRRALAAALQSTRLGQRLPHRQSGFEPETPCAPGGIGVVVPVLLLDAARRARLPAEHP